MHVVRPKSKSDNACREAKMIPSDKYLHPKSTSCFLWAGAKLHTFGIASHSAAEAIHRDDLEHQRALDREQAHDVVCWPN